MIFSTKFSRIVNPEIIVLFQGNTKLFPAHQMVFWISVLVRKDSNVKKESFMHGTSRKNEKQKRKSLAEAIG